MHFSSASKMNLVRFWRKLQFQFTACWWHIPRTGNSVKFLFWICPNVRNVSFGVHWHTQANLRLEVFRFPLQENVPFLKRLFFFSWLGHIFAAHSGCKAPLRSGPRSSEVKSCCMNTVTHLSLEVSSAFMGEKRCFYLSLPYAALCFSWSRQSHFSKQILPQSI